MGNGKSLFTMICVFILVIYVLDFFQGMVKENSLEDFAEETYAEENSEYVGIAMPNFKIYDEEGNSYTKKDFDGKPMFIYFWSTESDVSVNSLKYYQRDYETYGDEVQFLIINLTQLPGESEEKAKKVISDMGYTFPAYYDLQGTTMMAYDMGGLINVPAKYYINSDGMCMWSSDMNSGTISTEEAMALILDKE